MKQSIRRQVQHSITSLGLSKQQMLLAVSGGMDSMVLMHVFKELNIGVEVAHVNYGFRPEESAQEAALVQHTAEAWGLPFHTKGFNGYEDLEAAEERNLQIYARNLRYDFFKELLVSHQLDLIVTAHHEDDNAETILMHFVKGTGVSGLKGMPMLMDNKFKPFLSISKSELMQYALDHNIPFLNDSSNASSNYDRNFLRNEVLPLLEEKFPSVKHNLAMNAKRLSGFINDFEKMIAGRLRILLKHEGAQIYVFIDKLKKENYAEEVGLLLLKTYNFPNAQLEELFKLIASRNGASLASESHLMVKEDNRLVVVKKEGTQSLLTFDSLFALIAAPLEIGGAVYTFEQIVSSDAALDLENVWYVDADKVEFPIIIRVHQAGDYFYPLGLNKKKKISKFLIDEKVPNSLRAGEYVVLSDHKIIAVLGRRIDHRFAIHPNTNTVLKIQKI